MGQKQSASYFGLRSQSFICDIENGHQDVPKWMALTILKIPFPEIKDRHTERRELIGKVRRALRNKAPSGLWDMWIGDLRELAEKLDRK